MCSEAMELVSLTAVLGGGMPFQFVYGHAKTFYTKLFVGTPR